MVRMAMCSLIMVSFISSSCIRENSYPKEFTCNWSAIGLDSLWAADHFDYVKKLIGVDYIGIGGDYDGISYTITGMEDVSSYPKLLLELAKRGWTDAELRKISGKNFLRVFEEAERKAATLKQVKIK